MISVRAMRPADAPALLEMMKSLARIEGYIAEFRVTESDLIKRGFGDDPEFHALVAQDSQQPKALLGMAVFYWVPYTYDLRPDLVLKELFVEAQARSVGVGSALMKQLIRTAKEKGSARIKWLVLKNNAGAQRFYRSHNGNRDEKWENWQLLTQ